MSLRCFQSSSASKSRQGKANFVLAKTSKPAPKTTQPPIQRVPGIVPGGKRSGRLFDHSTRSSAEFKISGAMSLLPPCVLTTWTVTNLCFIFKILELSLLEEN
jgi:hypothetical protein